MTQRRGGLLRETDDLFILLEACSKFALGDLPCSIKMQEDENVPKYVIEREIPNAGQLSAEEPQAISQKSCKVLNRMGPQIQWVQSYVTGDKLYCVYIAPSDEMIRQHAQEKRVGFQLIASLR